ncbi:PREDICTED: venom prothrombin activator omicarin-C non-catalytic subunit-like [Acropora digitifera]|uniref:venom prothrombin activator omicarin-C non-catalytic subunit-like n=1 Tax=Acropora digitifera TaxID=70779 RepID=UPI00077A33FF|nr:PREDICTED: venom prothrombin activator omicarin-C non-catalytic subunit-like [Acropora digitifera]
MYNNFGQDSGVIQDKKRPSEVAEVEIFTGNSHKQEIVKNDLYNPLAVKFIRFYPEDFNRNKALRVEVFGSKQACFSSLGNEEGVTSPQLPVTASSQLDGSHTPFHSSLYGSSSWCSSGVASSPQYLQFDFGKVVTVSGIATQGDAVDNKWVTDYAVSYGYDEKSWLDYAGGQHLSGNSDKSSVVVHLFSSPFAAKFVRILPKIYHTAQCMRVDLFGCRDCKCSILCYIRLVIIFKGYYFIRLTYDNSLIIFIIICFSMEITKVYM